jgi:hypothetical protein
MLTFSQFIVEAAQQYWFHGTYKTNIESIKSHGMNANVPERVDDADDGVYVTPDFEEAADYGDGTTVVIDASKVKAVPFPTSETHHRIIKADVPPSAIVEIIPPNKAKAAASKYQTGEVATLYFTLDGEQVNTSGKDLPHDELKRRKLVEWFARHGNVDIKFPPLALAQVLEFVQKMRERIGAQRASVRVSQPDSFYMNVYEGKFTVLMNQLKAAIRKEA